MKVLIINSLKHGKFNVLYDDDDHELICKHTWTLNFKSQNQKYVYTTFRTNGIVQQLKMHHLICPISNNLVVDHIDGNGLNNRRDNLRLATQRQNICNKSIQRNNTTGYKGVHFHKKAKKYTVSFKINGRSLYGGIFVNIIEAAKRYNELAIKYYGEFAKLNPIP